MAQHIGPEDRPEIAGAERPARSGTPCPSYWGAGRKFTTLRRLVDAADGASENDLLKRTQTDCLDCSGGGQAAA
jgi:hypothetical protein